MPETCREEKYTKQNFAPSWIYLQDCTRMHGQQNIKFNNTINITRCPTQSSVNNTHIRPYTWSKHKFYPAITFTVSSYTCPKRFYSHKICTNSSTEPKHCSAPHLPFKVSTHKSNFKNHKVFPYVTP